MVIHTVQGFGIVNKAEVDIFLELFCFFDDPTDAGNLISGLERLPGEGNGNLLQYSCLENPMDSLVGYSPGGCKEWNTTEGLHSLMSDSLTPGSSVHWILQARILE